MTATYPGHELEIFQKATRWKAYWRGRIARYVRGSVLEVGAGIGANTSTLAGLSYRSWLALEPDVELAARIPVVSARHEIVVGTLGDLGGDQGFDTILYIDVLEHIADDRAEMAQAAEHLNSGGKLVVLAPAHSFLFSPFDRAIGHYRRYNRAALRAAASAGLKEEKLVYLDSCGLLASLGNRLFLGSAMPSERQICTWDTYLVPCSRWLDPLTAGRIGKSILGIWAKQA